MIAALRATLALVAAYHAALLVVAVARFGQLPDYVRVHPWLDNVWLNLTGMPTLTQAVSATLREPWLEAGRAVPDLPLAEWSIQILPPNLLLVTLTAFLLAVQWRRARTCRSPAATALTATGSAGTALAATSLTWVACCSSPSWVVLLAMLGMWIPTALSLDYLGPVIGGIGLILLGLGLLLQYPQKHRLRSRHAPFP